MFLVLPSSLGISIWTSDRFNTEINFQKKCWSIKVTTLEKYPLVGWYSFYCKFHQKNRHHVRKINKVIQTPKTPKSVCWYRFQLFQFIFWPLDSIGATCRRFQIIPSCRRDGYGCLDILNIKICPLVLISALLVNSLATRWHWFHLQKVLDHSIMQERSIWLFRHLEHQNLSIISGDIGRASEI